MVLSRERTGVERIDVNFRLERVARIARESADNVYKRQCELDIPHIGVLRRSEQIRLAAPQSLSPARSSGGNPQIISAILGLAATATLRKAFSPPSGAINALWITRLLALMFDGSEEPRAHRR